MCNLNSCRQPGPRVLVVDDDDRFRHALVKQLCFLGCTVHEADSGKKALKAFRRKGPSVVFLDGHLPEMKGFRILKALKRLDPRVRVIVFAGQGGCANRHVITCLRGKSSKNKAVGLF